MRTSASSGASSEVITWADISATCDASILPTNFQPAGILMNTKPVGGSKNTSRFLTGSARLASAATVSAWVYGAARDRTSAAAAIAK